MFAVPGWSVSADKLKSEVASAPADTAMSEPKKPKKRKRQSETVTSSNVADLWERVIENKKPSVANRQSRAQPKPKEKQDNRGDKKDKKRQKLDTSSSNTLDVASHDAKRDETEIDTLTPMKAQEKLSKKGKKGNKDKPKSKEATDDSKGAADVTASQNSSGKPSASSVAPAPSKLTPLQASMREKLISARFRHLNETLYTRPSADAFSLFQESPDMFNEYHEGFRRQVGVWPENPVEGYLADIRQRGRVRFPSKETHRHKKSQQQQQEQQDESKGDIQPLPRNRATGTCTIADLGCGDARLASELHSDKKRLRLDILSFDLHSPHPLVTKADVANLPVANGTVDVAIFCLALMGTNWVDFIEEAYRVLRWKGELWVAEIKSRFGHVGGGGGKKNNVVQHSVGHRRNPDAAGAKKSGSKSAGGNDETDLLVEVDGVDDARQQTDVRAFIKVLNQRGFVLLGQEQGPAAEAIDLSNKMFVKMKFLKAAPAQKGKCVRKDSEENGKSRHGGKLPTMAKKPKFLEADDEADSNEAAVLKPCVYKIR